MPMLSTHAVVAGEKVAVQMYVHPELYNDPDARESIERELRLKLALDVIEKLDIRVRAEFDQRDDLAVQGVAVWTTGQ